jgi:hypothetical protein
MNVRQSKVWISVLMLVVIGLHAIPVLSYQGNRQTRWPFLAWAMYAASIPPGPITTSRRWIVGVTATGDTEELSAQSIGVSGPGLVRSYLQPLWAGDTATAQQLLERLNRVRSDSFVALKLEGVRFTLVDSGVVKEEFTPRTYRPAGAGTR